MPHRDCLIGRRTLTKLNKIGNYQKTECKVSVQTKPSLESEAVAAINFWQASFFLWLTLQLAPSFMASRTYKIEIISSFTALLLKETKSSATRLQLATLTLLLHTCLTPKMEQLILLLKCLRCSVIQTLRSACRPQLSSWDMRLAHCFGWDLQTHGADRKWQWEAFSSSSPLSRYISLKYALPRCMGVCFCLASKLLSLLSYPFSSFQRAFLQPTEHLLLR